MHETKMSVVGAIRFGELVNSRGNSTPTKADNRKLYNAAMKGHNDEVVRLLRAGADSNEEVTIGKHGQRKSARSAAMQRGFQQIVETMNCWPAVGAWWLCVCQGVCRRWGGSCTTLAAALSAKMRTHPPVVATDSHHSGRHQNSFCAGFGRRTRSARRPVPRCHGGSDGLQQVREIARVTRETSWCRTASSLEDV